MCFWDINSSSTTSLLVCKRRFEYRYFASIFLLDAHVVLFVSIYYSHPRADARVNVFKGIVFFVVVFKGFSGDEKEKNSANASFLLPSLSLPSLRRRNSLFFSYLIICFKHRRDELRLENEEANEYSR